MRQKMSVNHADIKLLRLGLIGSVVMRLAMQFC